MLGRVSAADMNVLVSLTETIIIILKDEINTLGVIPKNTQPQQYSCIDLTIFIIECMHKTYSIRVLPPGRALYLCVILYEMHLLPDM